MFCYLNSLLGFSEVVIITLSGQTNTGANSGADANASFKIRDNGNIYESDNGGADVQIDTLTDWCRPNDRAGDYEWRWTNASGDVGDITATDAEDTWVDTDLEVTLTDTSPGAPNKTVTFDFEVRYKATGALRATGSYTLIADRED